MLLLFSIKLVKIKKKVWEELILQLRIILRLLKENNGIQVVLASRNKRRKYVTYGTSGEIELRGGDDEARLLGDGTRRRRPPWHVDGDRGRQRRERRG